MGRSKFPGKPSKHINRKRINVLPPNLETNECSSSMTVETCAENKQLQDETEQTQINGNGLNPKVSLRRRLKMQTNNRSLLKINGVTNKITVKNKIKCKGTRKPIKKTKVTYSKIKKFKKQCTRKPSVQKEPNSIVGKFVLPTRSVHSSRVIKPNKRFLNVDLNETIIKKKAASKRVEPTDAQGAEAAEEGPKKVVLRQARLKLHNTPKSGPNGPFSSCNGSPPGTVTCGVCGAVRCYRFVKQARKFNIYSCESCRKFISKLIKRQTCGKSAPAATLVCHKGLGLCHVPPVVRPQAKLIRCAYRARCPACWLKMCLRSFQMPMSLKNGLVQLLPEHMRAADVIFSNSLPLLWQASTQTIDSRPFDAPATSGEVKQRPVRLKLQPKAQQAPTADVKRQKVDLKGPRVKHVCRSASIVLGQPLATFPPAESAKKAEIEEKKVEKVASSETDSDFDRIDLLAAIKRRKPVQEYDYPIDPNTILIDYFNADFDEVLQNGFSLITTKQTPMPAICFICASAGRERLINCTFCCEAYHPFCLDLSPVSVLNRSGLWACPKCVKCDECKQNGVHISCQKCGKGYHNGCFSKKHQTVCLKCLTCKCCKLETIGPFGNLGLCTTCFKLRKKGSFCGICRGNYDSFETNEKILECTNCSKLVHATCEGLSYEQFYLISQVDTIKYRCNLCTKQTNTNWRKNIEAVLKTNYNRIFYQLIKNPTIRLLLNYTEPEDQIDNNNKVDSGINPLQLIDFRARSTTSIFAFNKEMEEVLRGHEVVGIYWSIFKTVFPNYSLTSPESAANSIEEETIDIDTQSIPLDSRYCSLCNSIGDGLSHLESRLLYSGQNKWVHLNCAIWSSPVFETIDGALFNLQTAFFRGQMLRCATCKQKGATVGCAFKDCYETYHFICARTAKCHFFTNRKVYCGNHELVPPLVGLITNPQSFVVKRRVYVDLSDQTEKYATIEQINVLVGNLCVTNLGKFTPGLSDQPDGIIPTGYVCSRLFWSTVEPWKLVSYKITTSILNYATNCQIVDKNYTVDHSLPKAIVERKIKEIIAFLELSKKSELDFEDEEEPQNGADLLSPEITDAILKELPHEILDGISVQDLFPKLNYEDFINLDAKSELEPTSDELSVTVSCKLDQTFSPVIKKRKLGFNAMQILQVDGNMDESSDDENGESWTQNGGFSEEPVTCERCQSTYRTQASFKRHLDGCEVITSESESDLNEEIETKANQSMVLASYEFQQNEICTQVLNTSTFVTTKSTTQEVIAMPQNDVYQQKNDFESSFCLNQPICVNSMMQPLDFQTQVQVQPYLNQIAPNRFVKAKPKPIKKLKPTPTRTIAAKGEEMVINTTAPSVIVQHVTAPNFLPAFDNYQPQNNVQYVTVPQAQPLMQLQSADNNFISVVQPTMIFQPQNQLVLDSNGSLTWTQAPIIQPVCYGFETIVQNTVMQSQQFLPGTVPSVLTNSSYTTTQVFQTSSKLEPVLDANSYVLLNSGQLVPQSLDNTQIQPVGSGGLSKTIADAKYSNAGAYQPQKSISASNSNSISLPTAPFVHEQGIPMNIVTPTPKSNAPQPISANRPMSRVLPMQTVKETNKIKLAWENSEIEKILERKASPPPIDKTDSRPVILSNKLIEPFFELEMNLAKVDKLPSLSVPVLPTPLSPVTVLPTPVSPVPVLPTPVLSVPVLPTPAKIGANTPSLAPVLPTPVLPTPVLPTPILPTLLPPPPKPAFKPNQENVHKPPSVPIAPLKPLKPLPLADKQNLPERRAAAKPCYQPDAPEPGAPALLYTIETHDGVRFSSTSLAELWARVIETVQRARAEHGMRPLPAAAADVAGAMRAAGARADALRYLLEQLPGAAGCARYKRRFEFAGRGAEADEELVGHGSGCGRAAACVKRVEPCDLFGWLASKHRKPEVRGDLLSRRGTANNLPMATRFRQLKNSSKSVGVYRSRIHKRGLFSLRDFDAGEMVIEYSGEVIRSILTDKREKYYNSKGIGCYMFRIDDNLVVDATMTGNAARFINHSCDPNCYSKVVEICGHKHIIIFALRRILSGEELTYDYKFPIEEDKILCTCGARRCRKFLN